LAILDVYLFESAKEFVPNDFPEYQLEYGQLATEGEPFCPWQVLRRYPYVYIGGGNKDKASFWG